METRDLLVEIGTEELPPKSLKRLLTDLQTNVGQELSRANFSFDEIKGYATPRRLAVLIKALPSSQPQQQTEKRGPAVTAAFDEAGHPTKAAEGFARSCGVSVGDLERMETDKGEWLVFRETKPGQSIESLIENIVSNALENLPIDRRMRWGASRVQFVRPVHWVVALYGADVIPATIMELPAGRETRGHRFMGKTISLKDANDYAASLYKQYVLADFEDRKKEINRQLLEEAKKCNGTAVIENALLEEVTALVEWPVALAGHFDERFLELPEEVLISVMTEHQRYFHLRDNRGKLLPRFLTVANIESADPDTIVSGNERVIEPRLADAAFFYEVDTRSTLEDKVQTLGNVVFQSELGTYLQKAERLSMLAGAIAKRIGTNEIHARRAGRLAKADLVSDMVGEFPDLQGIMGSYYALADGEPDAIARAIGDHYLPIQAGGRLPAEPVACCIALADKLDTLVGLFAIGQPPSGSRDPFALRRQALGVVRICVEKELDLNLKECLQQAAECYSSQLTINSSQLDEIQSWIIDRLANWCQDQGISTDTFNAVRQSREGITNLLEAYRRVMAMHSFRKHPRAENLAAANKRVANILKDIDTNTLATPDDKLFEAEAERTLVQSMNEAREKMDAALDYETQLLALADLQPHIDRYFDDVMVMTDDATQRDNRLATVWQMRRLFLNLADFSLLQPSAGE
ncbi:MAG: glycine--tRNA ligase subunit beta [Pseudomonadales bacterium]